MADQQIPKTNPSAAGDGPDLHLEQRAAESVEGLPDQRHGQQQSAAVRSALTPE